MSFLVVGVMSRRSSGLRRYDFLKMNMRIYGSALMLRTGNNMKNEIIRRIDMSYLMLKESVLNSINTHRIISFHHPSK
jgi:hypothetical protein